MPEHPIVHVDIPAKDPEAVSRFYSELFGWQMQSFPGMRYIRFQPGTGPTGGFPDSGELLVYVESSDIDGDLRRAEQLGGKILVPKTEIPNTGWFGVFEDPAGNHLGLFHRTGYMTP